MRKREPNQFELNETGRIMLLERKVAKLEDEEERRHERKQYFIDAVIHVTMGIFMTILFLLAVGVL